MIAIIQKPENLSATERYLMTASPDIVSIKDVEDGKVIPVKKWIIFEDAKQDESVVEILSILTEDNKVYSTQSATFKEAFSDIVDCVNDDGHEKFSIIKKSGKSKAGRSFVTCTLDVNSLN